MVAILLTGHNGLITVPPELVAPLHKIEPKHRRIDSFRDEQCHMYFRFETREKLRRVFRAFQFPEWMKDSCGHKYSGEEVFLVGLYRMRNASTYAAACWEDTFGLTYVQASSMFNLFIGFMVESWGYLLTNNVDFWLPSLPLCALALQNKLADKGVVFPHPLRAP
jgi:hypothetical protein